MRRKDASNCEIHSIEKTRRSARASKTTCRGFHGCSGIGCISDTDPQPLLVRSHLGTFGITTVGAINNAEELVERTSPAAAGSSWP